MPLGSLLADSLIGLTSSPEKDFPPATETVWFSFFLFLFLFFSFFLEMVCLGVLVNTEDLTLRVPDSRLRDLSDKLHLWLSYNAGSFGSDLSSI